MAYNVAIIMLTTLLIGTAVAQAPPPLLPATAPRPLSPTPPSGPGPMLQRPPTMGASPYAPAPGPMPPMGISPYVPAPSPSSTATSPTSSTRTLTGAEAPTPSAAVSNGVATFGTFAVGLLVISLAA